MSVGSLVFVKLDNLVPPWRQAVVLQNRRKGQSLQLAVRLTEEELQSGDTWKKVSFFECHGNKYILVEGDTGRIRMRCSSAHRALELDEGLIQDAAKHVLEGEDVQFATASEEPSSEAAKPKKESKTRSLSSESGSDSADSGDSEDPLLNMLGAAKKRMTGGATGSDNQEPASSSKRGARYAMLAKSSKKEKDDGDLAKTLGQAVKGGAGLSSSQVNTLLQLEILKALKGKGSKDDKTQKEDSSQASGEDLSSSSSDQGVRMRGAGRALQAYRRGGRAMRKHPTRHIKRYVREVEEILGVTPESAYQLTDYTKKLSWGKHRA